MAKNPTTKAPKAVRAFCSVIGRKGGSTGKGTEKSNAKTRAATEARKAKQAERAAEVKGGGPLT
jgi:hypothetical protein